MSYSIMTTDKSRIDLPTDEKGAAEFLAHIVTNHGRVPGEDGAVADWNYFVNNFLVGKDAVSVSNIRPLLASTTEIILREPLQPILNITNQFTRIMAQGLETRVLAGALGAVHAADIAENQTYPEVFFSVGGGVQTAHIGKSGIAAAFSAEALRYSTWDIMAINLRRMREAMDRHKEQKAAAVLREAGTTVFDNLSPSTSVFGVCTGRGLDMAANGSVTMDDLFKAMTFGAEEGFMPDTMLIHPVHYLLWLQDPVLRNMLLAHGGGAYFQQWQGNPGPLDPWNNGAMGMMGPTLGNKVVPSGAASGETPTGISGREHGMTSQPTLPPYFPWNFRIVVSPLIPFDVNSGLADIFLLSSGNVGYYLVDEELQQVSWTDEAIEQVKVKLRERYTFAIGHEGQGVQVLKNIPTTRNYWDGTVEAWTASITSEISPTTDLSSVL